MSTTTTPPLVYDLYPTLTWDKDTISKISQPRLSSPSGSPWHCTLSPDATLVAIVTDTCIEVHPFNDAHEHPKDINSRIAHWEIPTAPDSKTGIDSLVWRRIVWSSDGRWLLLVDWDGVIYLLTLCINPLQLVCTATIKPDPVPSNKSDPIAFVALHRQDLPSSPTHTEQADYLLIYVSIQGMARSIKVSVLVQVDQPIDPLNLFYDQPGDNTYLRICHCQWFDASPWFHAITDATWINTNHTLYVTGKTDRPRHMPRSASSKKKHHDHNSTSTPIPIIPLSITSTGIYCHSTIHSSVPLRTAQSRGLFGSLFDMSSSLFINVGRRVGILSSREIGSTMSAIDFELTGVQISAWTALNPVDNDLPMNLLLLRDAGGNLLVLDGDLNPRDRYPSLTIKSTNANTDLTYAAWWHCPVPSGSSQTLAAMPGIVTCSNSGVMRVHSYPQFTPLSSTEQFFVPMSISHTLDGWGCILDCKLTTAMTQGPVRSADNMPGLPKPAKRGIFPRALKYLTNTFLWHFDEDNNNISSPKPTQPFLTTSAIEPSIRLHFTMYQWCPLSPQEMLMRHLMENNYDLALDLTLVYNMNPDIVYQKQWESMIQSVSHTGAVGLHKGSAKDQLIGILSKITDRLWVLQSCVDACPSDSDVAHELLVYGLSLTDAGHDWAAPIIERSGTYPSDIKKEAVEEDKQDLNLVAFRLTILRLMDRLELFTRIHGNNRLLDLNADQNYQFLRTANLVDVACAYARLSNTRALSILYTTHPSLSPFRLIIAECFPPYVDPELYVEIALPNLTNCTQQATKQDRLNWRNPDWCEHPAITEIVGWTDDSGHAAAALKVKPIDTERDLAPLTSWYLNRAREIEAGSGCIDHALRLLELGISFNIPGLTSLAANLSQMSVLVYDLLPTATDTLSVWQRMTLAEFDSMSPDYVFKLFFRTVFDVNESQFNRKEGSKSVSRPIGCKLLFEEADRQFLVPFTVARHAHVALLTELKEVFQKRPELVVKILSCDNLWWHGSPHEQVDKGLVRDLDVEFAEYVLEMIYSIQSADKRWHGLLKNMFRLIPEISPVQHDSAAIGGRLLNNDVEGKRASVRRKVHACKSLITASDVLSYLDLYITPSALRHASRHPNVIKSIKVSPLKQSGSLFQLRRADDRTSWTQDQYSILRELVRRTPMTNSDMGWLINAMEELVALNFWRIPLEDVYTPLVQHALLMHSATYFKTASQCLSEDTLKRVIMQLVHERAEAFKFLDCVKILETAHLPALSLELTMYCGICSLQDLGVPNLSHRVSTEELISLATQCHGISREAVFKLGKDLGLSEINITSILITNVSKEQAVELVLNLVLSMPSMNEDDRGLVCDTVINLVTMSTHRSEVLPLLHSCLEFAPTQFIFKLISVWNDVDLSMAQSHPLSNDITVANTVKNKLVCPLYTSMFRSDPTLTDVAMWFATDEFQLRHTSTPKDVLSHSVSVHSALPVARCCSPQDNDALFHHILLFAMTKRMAAATLGADAGSTDLLAVTCTDRSIIDEFMHLSLTQVVDPSAILVATEFQALDKQTIDRAMADYPDIDSAKFSSCVQYQLEVLHGLLKLSSNKSINASMNSAILLAEHADIPAADLLVYWLEANAEYMESENLLAHLPHEWSQWITLTCENSQCKEKFLIAARTLLESDRTTNQCQAVVYHTIAKVVPEFLYPAHERQSLAELIIEHQFNGCSAHELSTRYLQQDQAYILGICRAVINTEHRYETVLNEVIPKMAKMTLIPCIDNIVINTPEKTLTVQDLESIATVAWLTQLVHTSTAFDDPATKFFYSIQTSRNRRNDDGRFGRLFASIASTNILSPSLPTADPFASRMEGPPNPTILLLQKIQAGDWSLLRETIVNFVRQSLGPQHLTLMKEFLVAVQAIAEDMAIVALLEATAVVNEYAKYAFVHRLLMDSNASYLAIQELLQSGCPISDMQGVACKVSSVQQKLSLAMHESVKAPYTDSVFESDLRNAFQSIATSCTNDEFEPILKSISQSKSGAEILIDVLTNLPQSLSVQVDVESLITRISLASPTLAHKRDIIRIINGSLADLSRDMVSLHKQWIHQCTDFDDHEFRIQKLLEWCTNDVSDHSSLWVNEMQFAQGFPVDYIVNLRLQLPSFPPQMEHNILQCMKSQVHILAFSLTSTDRDIMTIGIGLLPKPICDDQGKTLIQKWPSPTLDALIPVIQSRHELLNVADRFGIGAQDHVPNQPPTKNEFIHTVLSNMHPALWTSIVAGRISISAVPAETSRPVSSKKSDLSWQKAIELSDVDNLKRTLWARSKYNN